MHIYYNDTELKRLWGSVFPPGMDDIEFSLDQINKIYNSCNSGIRIGLKYFMISEQLRDQFILLYRLVQLSFLEVTDEDIEHYTTCIKLFNQLMQDKPVTSPLYDIVFKHVSKEMILQFRNIHDSSDISFIPSYVERNRTLTELMEDIHMRRYQAITKDREDLLSERLL